MSDGRAQLPNELLQIIVDILAEDIRPSTIHPNSSQSSAHSIATRALCGLASCSRFLGQCCREHLWSTLILYDSGQCPVFCDESLITQYDRESWRTQSTLSALESNPRLFTYIKRFALVFSGDVVPEEPSKGSHHDFVKAATIILERVSNMSALFLLARTEGRMFYEDINRDVQVAIGRCLVRNPVKDLQMKGINVPSQLLRILPSSLSNLQVLLLSRDLPLPQSTFDPEPDTSSLDALPVPQIPAFPISLSIDLEACTAALEQQSQFYSRLKSFSFAVETWRRELVQDTRWALTAAASTLQTLRFAYDDTFIPDSIPIALPLKDTLLPSLTSLELDISYALLEDYRFAEQGRSLAFFLSSHCIPSFRLVRDLKFTIKPNVEVGTLEKRARDALDFTAPPSTDPDESPSLGPPPCSLYNFSHINDTMMNQGLATFTDLKTFTFSIVPGVCTSHGFACKDDTSLPLLDTFASSLLSEAAVAFAELKERVEVNIVVLNPEEYPNSLQVLY